MGDDWILNVLTDLKTFAEQNEYYTLAAQLEDATVVARIEIANAADDEATQPASEQSKEDQPIHQETERT